MAIYEITHIYDNKYFRKDRVMMMVGNKKHEGILSESDFEDNIAEKNPNYCELTAIYALYKNLDDDFYGIEHYRRYFCNIFGNIITSQECKTLINQGKVILPIRNRMNPNNYLNYTMHHKSKDIENLRDIIAQNYRDYYEAYEKVMCSDKLSCFNMIVCDKNTFNAYCDWLFEILNKIEKKTEIKNYTAYQARLYGFLSERLLNVWIEKNVPVCNRVYRDVRQVDATNRHVFKTFLRTIRANLLKNK